MGVARVGKGSSEEEIGISGLGGKKPCVGREHQDLEGDTRIGNGGTGLERGHQDREGDNRTGKGTTELGGNKTIGNEYQDGEGDPLD
jgi:hypothetical protein